MVPYLLVVAVGFGQSRSFAACGWRGHGAVKLAPAARGRLVGAIATVDNGVLDGRRAYPSLQLQAHQNDRLVTTWRVLRLSHASDCYAPRGHTTFKILSNHGFRVRARYSRWPAGRRVATRRHDWYRLYLAVGLMVEPDADCTCSTTTAGLLKRSTALLQPDRSTDQRAWGKEAL